MVHLLHKERKKKGTSHISIDWKHPFDVMSDFVAIVDTDYGVVRMNKAMACKLGVKSEQAAGCFCYA